MSADAAPMSVGVPCPDCGELSPQAIEHLVANDVVPCSLCMGLIDLTAADCRPIVDEARRLWQSKPR